MMPGGHFIWMGFWWVIGIGLFIALLWFLADVIRLSPPNESPETILRRRLAAGEIDAEEFERRLAMLQKTKHAA